MDDSLLAYYERELGFIREMGVEFAKKYPKIAGRLLLEPDKCEDPHTERLIEAFAFLSARIHKKLDDDFPQLTQALLNIVYPHYVNPIPSMSIAAFDPVKQNIPAVGYRIDAGTTLYSKPVGGDPCQFRTCYPVTVWPLEVVSVTRRDAEKVVGGAREEIIIGFRTFNNLGLAEIPLDSVRFFLNGPAQHAYHLYELLLNHVCHVECEIPVDEQGRVQVVVLEPSSLRPVGFGAEEALLPLPRRTFGGYRILFEYFCFAEKFLFIDIAGLDRLRHTGVLDRFNLHLYLDRGAKPGLVLNEETFQLNATPVVNLFTRIAEPIRIEQRKPQYHVIADIRRQMATEVYSIERVESSLAGTDATPRRYYPFYSLQHHLGDEAAGEEAVFWHPLRRASGRKGDNGTEVYLSFVDAQFRPELPAEEVLTVHVTCTNRDLPNRLPFGDPLGDFDLEIAAPIAGTRCLSKPTPTRRLTPGGALQWRLISHLSLNYLSLVGGGVEMLREMLKLYDFDDSPATRQQIDGIAGVASRHVTRRIGRSFARGVEVTLDLDEEKFVGGSVYLFASVLEHFLGQYVSVNSFTQLVARTLQRKEVLMTWPPRNGNRILL